MLPTILLTAEEAIRMVPREMREAAIGMGATQTQVIWHVLLPTALPGILTGVLLALARGAGETAPLLFTHHVQRLLAQPRSLDGADRLAGRPDLQLLRSRRSRTRRRSPGPPRWCSSSSCSRFNLGGQVLSPARGQPGRSSAT